MNEYRDISELLESDSRAMAFYNSLSMPLRRKIHRAGVRDLEALYKCVSGSGSPLPGAGADTGAMNTVSADECTGCVPAGSDLSSGGWENAKDCGH